MSHPFLSEQSVQLFKEYAAQKKVNMTPEALARYAAMKRPDGAPQYQFVDPNPKHNSLVSKGMDVDYYDDVGDKQYGVVVSVNAASGIVKIKDSKTKKTVDVVGYPKGVIK